MTVGDGDALVDSDRAYFEIGALVESRVAARVAYMAGIVHAAGAVAAHRIDVGSAERDPGTWLSGVEACFEQIGAHRGRIYLDQRSCALEAGLGDLGYVHRVEHGFVVPPIEARADVVLRPIEDARLPASLFANDSPDGHDADAASWLRLHERKDEDPAFTWMAILDRSDEVLGSVAALRIDDLLRVKNLWIAPAHRHRGVAAAVLAALQQMATAEHRWLGIFSVAGSEGDSLYRGLGAIPIVEWHEWSRHLAPVAAHELRPPKRRSSS